MDLESIKNNLLELIDIGDENGVLKILDSGIDPNYEILHLSPTSVGKGSLYVYTPLLFAVETNYIHIFKLLINYGADPFFHSKMAKNGNSPLQYVIKCDDSDILKIFIQNKPDHRKNLLSSSRWARADTQMALSNNLLSLMRVFGF